MDTMNPLHPKKLLLTKWTAAQPVAKRKHFVVTKVIAPDEPDGIVEWVEIEAVHSRTVTRIPWRELQNAAVWRQGWV